MAKPFNWDKVGEELAVLVEAIDAERPEETVPVYPMVTNDFGMSVLANMWARGWRLVPHTDGLIPEMQTALDEAFPGWRLAAALKDALAVIDHINGCHCCLDNGGEEDRATVERLRALVADEKAVEA